MAVINPLAINALTIKPLSQNPCGIVTVNGVTIPFEKIEVNNNTHFLSDTFFVEIPIKSLPTSFPLSSFLSQPALVVEIFLGYPSNLKAINISNLQNIIKGNVDIIDYDPVEGVITLNGRDLSSLFMDTRTTEKFNNLTSSQIATQLATEQGLTPVVTETSTKVGLYYELDHARMAVARTEWDILTYLAEEENFDVFVKGSSLYFQPKTTTTKTPFVISINDQGQAIQTNVTKFKFHRYLTLASNINVKVKSWNLKSQTGFEKTATATHKTGGGQSLTYTYFFPNLSPEQALQKAQSILTQVSQHEMNIKVEMPGDSNIDITTPIVVTDSYSTVNQVYYVNSIVRRLSADEGFVMEIEARNISAESTIAL